METARQAAARLTTLLNRTDWRTASRAHIEGARNALATAADEIDRLTAVNNHFHNVIGQHALKMNGLTTKRDEWRDKWHTQAKSLAAAHKLFEKQQKELLATKPRWIEDGDSTHLMWGHIKVGEVALGGSGTWFSFYRYEKGGQIFKTIGSFPAPDLAQREVEKALAALQETK